MKKNIIMATIAVASLGSCGIYSKYERPALPTDSLYRAETTQGQDSLHLGRMHWRQVFTDPHLVRLIEQGLANNTDLRTAQLKVEQAEATLSAARLAFLPSFALAPQGTLSSIEAHKPTQTYTLPLTASWQVDIFGSLRNAKKRSQALVLASRDYRQAVQAQVIAAIARTYYSLTLLDAQLKVSEETEQLWKETLRAMKAMMAAGRYNDAAVSSAEANYYQISSSVLALRQQILETESTLALLLGEAYLPSRERSSLDSWHAPQQIKVGYPAQLLADRPDVRRAEQSLASAFYSVGAARSAFYPSVTLSGSAGWTNNLGTIINPGKLLLTAVGSLTQPLFMKGQLRANLKIAKSQQEEAKRAFVQTLLNAGAEVNNYLSQVQTYSAQEALYHQRTEALRRSTKATHLLMQSGSSTYIEVLTAETNFLSAQLEELKNRYNQISATISLYQALGGGTEQ